MARGVIKIGYSLFRFIHVYFYSVHASTFNKVICFCVQKFPPSMQASGLFMHLGPVPQNPIKLILDQWKVLIAIYLPLKKDFSQD